MKLADKSASALTWLAVMLFVPGVLIQSPGGRFPFVVLATLVALVPAFMGSARRRVFAGIVAAISLLVAIATYPEFGKEQGAYRDRVRQQPGQPGTK